MSEATPEVRIAPCNHYCENMCRAARTLSAEADANRLADQLEDRTTAAHNCGLITAGHHYEVRTCPQSGCEAAREALRLHKEQSG